MTLTSGKNLTIMNIHEYQAKEVLKSYGVKIQEGIVADSPEAALEAAKKLTADTGTSWYVLKAQIHAGGRGKGEIKDVPEKAKDILNGTLVTIQTGEEGKLVKKILVAQDVYYPGNSEPKEYYLSILLDRATGSNIIMASTEGGVNIEEIAESTPEKIIKEWVDPMLGIQPYQARNVAFKLGLEGNAFKEMVKFIMALYAAYDASDASQFEISPVLKTSDDQILAVDAKVNLDDNALYRNKDLAAMRDLDEEDPFEVEAAESGLNYVKLDGNVGCMVNGHYGHDQTFRWRAC